MSELYDAQGRPIGTPQNKKEFQQSVENLSLRLEMIELVVSAMAEKLEIDVDEIAEMLNESLGLTDEEITEELEG